MLNFPVKAVLTMRRLMIAGLTSLGLLFSALPAWAQTWKINLRDADMTAFIAEVGEITGRNFAVDPRVKGTVTVVSSRPLSAGEVYELFQGVMAVNNVLVVPDGKVTKLIPDSNVRQTNVPFDLRGNSRGGRVVTRVIVLDNTSANDLVPAIRPLLPQFAHLAAVPGSNALIVSDRADSINQLESLIRQLDGSGSDQIETISLKEARADEVMNLIEAMTGTSAASRDPRGSRVRVIADPRSNRILIKGDSRSRARIRALIAKLDVPPSDRLSGLRVFRLKNASARNIAEILRGLITNTNATIAAQPNTLTPSTSLGSSSTSTGSMANLSSNTAASSTLNTPSYSGSGSYGSTGSGSGTAPINLSIIADESQNALIVRADPTLMREIESAISQLDQRRNQVLIQAAIVEVQGKNLEQLGVQWALGNPNSGVGIINFNTAGSATSLLNVAAAAAGGASGVGRLAGGLGGALLGAGNVRRNAAGDTTGFYGLVVNALNSTSGGNLLSVPSIITLDNEEANIVVGQNVPFITGTTATGAGGTVNPFTTIQRQDVGITLKVIPHIGDGGTVRLEVVQEVSAVEKQVSGINSSDLITNKRMVKTTVLAEDGQTIVLGGLMENANNQVYDQVPGLSRLPLVGSLFRSKSNDVSKRNLLIFLQPTILRDGSNVANLSQQRYDQIRSLQLELDQNGDLARLPTQVERVYDNSATAVSPALRVKQP